MTSQPNDARPSQRPSGQPGGGASQNLEFDFDGRTKVQQQGPQISTRPAPEPASPKPADPAPRATAPASQPSQSKPQSTTTMNQGFSQYQQNIQRQSREQRAVGGILSGVAIILVGCILLVAIMAAFGGWFLYKEIQNQSLTVAQLQSQINNDIQALQGNIKELEEQLDRLTAQSAAQKQQIGWLQTQIEGARAQAKKDAAALATRLQKIENRTYDLERNAYGR